MEVKAITHLWVVQRYMTILSIAPSHIEEFILEADNKKH